MAQSAIDFTSVVKDDPEKVLALSRPFGDISYLDECTWSRYASRLAMLEEHMPEAAPARQALNAAGRLTKYRIIGDPTVRGAINQALTHFKFHTHDNIEPARRILEIATEKLASGSTLPLLQLAGENRLRIGDKLYHGWIWTGDVENNESTRFFAEMVEANLAPAGLSLKPAGAESIRTLIKAAELLDTLLPDLASSALDHAHLIALIDHTKPFLSVTNPKIPGVIFLSESVLTSPWKAAEYLLHESLHAKFLDIEHTHSLLRQGYQPIDCTVRPPWRRPHSADPYLWPMNRILTVSHVYTALSLLFQVIQEKGEPLVEEYGPIHEKNLDFTIRQNLDRAEYLVHQLHLSQAWLGPAGVHWANWLASVLNVLDRTPRPDGAFLHLLSDLYERETNVLAKLVAGASPEQLHSALDGTRWFVGTTPAAVLEEMLAQEIAAVEQIASKYQSTLLWPAAIKDQDNERKPSPAELAQRLWGARSLMCQELSKIPASRYTVPEQPAVLEGMLLNSSRHVETLLKSLRTAA